MAAYLRVLDAKGNRIPVTALTGTFEGATFGRRLKTWGTQSYGPNSDLFSSLATLRSRSRTLAKNDAISSGAFDVFPSNLIGCGISPRWQLEDKELKAQIQRLWNDWTQEADADGAYDFYGLQTLVARSLMESGEVLVRFRFRRQIDGLSVPLQLQVLEPDHLDETYSEELSNGNKIRMGIEFNKLGKRVAYHLYREHPGEFFPFENMSGQQRVRVPASQVLHIYRKLRPGQIRGRPWLSGVILKLHDLDQYDDAELVRKKTAAMFGGFITEPPGEDTDLSPLGKVEGKDSEDREIVAVEPGTFPVLPPGMDVKFSEPADVGGNYENWMKQQLRKIARGIGLTYEQLTGDMEKVTYSSARVALLEFRRFCRQLQLQVLAFQFCRPVSITWMRVAVLSGALNIPDFWENEREYTRIKWRPDGWAWVDPLKDQQAEKLSVRNGFKSRAQVIAELGQDIENVDREIAEDNARADDLGLVFDSDPRKVVR